MIVGLYILVGLSIYAVLSIIIIVIGIKLARARGKPGWKGALMMTVIMYLALFWDQIPIHVAHEYYCSTEGGYSLNKSFEEWKKENPGIAETLVQSGDLHSLKEGDRERYTLNQRFAWDIISAKKILGLRKREERIVDVVTGEVLAKYVDFDSNQQTREPKEFRDFKIWNKISSCEKQEDQKMRPLKFKFNKIMYLFQNAKEYR